MREDVDDVLGVKTPGAGPASAGSAESPRDFIQRIRDNTCYSTLRGLIGFSSFVLIIGFILLALYCLNTQGLEVYGVIISVLGIFLAIAYQQASSLLIDIADTLIEQNRSKNRPTPEPPGGGAA